MAPSSKNATPSNKDRRKSGIAAAGNGNAAASSKIVTLKVTPERLRAIFDPDILMEDAPASKASPAAANSNTENATESNPNSPSASTPAGQSVMGPPAEGPKKKGVKRGAAALGPNGEPKPRGKPGPKKKQRLEDGTIVEEPSRKLGPKANQGAINAGLRALDRSGKPCRKWTRGTFQMKSFTGVVWEIPRWTAPPRPKPETAAPDDAAATVAVNGNGATPASTAADNNSNKENNNPSIAAAKVEDASSQTAVKSEMSTGGGDIEMQSVAPSIAPSPAPVPIAAA